MSEFGLRGVCDQLSSWIITFWLSISTTTFVFSIEKKIEIKFFAYHKVSKKLLSIYQFQDRDDATTIAYQDDIYYVLNEVEQKTADALEASVIILKFKLTANNSEEVIAQRDEIFTKGQNTIVLIKKWIQDNNATGQLVGESEECIEHVLQMTVDDTLEYMNKLRYECWKNDAWLGDIADITANLTELAQKGKDLYGEVGKYVKPFCMCSPSPISIRILLAFNLRLLPFPRHDSYPKYFYMHFYIYLFHYFYSFFIYIYIFKFVLVVNCG